MNKFIKKFAIYIKFCVFLGILTFGIVTVTPREVNAKNINSIVVKIENE